MRLLSNQPGKSVAVMMAGALMIMLMVFSPSSSVDAFMTTYRNVGRTTDFVASSSSAVKTTTRTSTTTRLSERQWNFNEGQSPWGLKKNAEIWNGRVAQMAFVWVFLQELVTGKGVIKGIDEGDAFFIANGVLFALTLVGLTGWLAIKGDNDYTKDV